MSVCKIVGSDQIVQDRRRSKSISVLELRGYCTTGKDQEVERSKESGVGWRVELQTDAEAAESSISILISDSGVENRISRGNS